MTARRSPALPPLHVSDAVPALLAQLDDVLQVVVEEAGTGEALRRPPPETQQALQDSGVFRLTLPASLGGYEASPIQVIEVVEKVSYADASIGWLVAALHTETTQTAVLLRDHQLALNLFERDPIPLVAGPSAIPGTATRVGGGYRLQGTWRFVPGLSMASYVRANAVVKETGATIYALIPTDQLTIADNWDVLGLRATASLDYSCDDVFVADEYVHIAGEPRARRGGAIHRLPSAEIAGISQAAWALGIGRRLIDELRVLSQAKVHTPGAPMTTDEYYGEFARHEVALRAARALLRDIWTDAERTLAEGCSLNREQETLSRLASGHVTRTALEISQLVHRFAGPVVLRDGPLQQFFRDIHAGTQHRGSSAVVTQECGRMLSGAAPDEAYWGAFNVLTDPFDEEE